MTEDRIASPRRQYDIQYRAFQEREGIPVHRGLFLDDVRTAAVDDWDRTGGRGAFVNLDGMESVTDVQLHEIPAASELEPQRHLHEALVYVVAGRGFTTLGIGATETTFEWDDGAVFYLPHNTPYRLSNADRNRPARLMLTTTLPLYYNLFRTDEAIWNLEGYDQWSLVSDENYYSRVAELATADDTRTYWDSNFIPDATGFDQLASWSLRGAGNKSVFFPFRHSAMDSHISEFQSGMYKKAHRHLSGANLLILTGEGYSLLWREGDEDARTRVDWSPYSLFTPPTMTFHQHFNTSTEPARYVVFHGAQQHLGLQLYRSSDGADPLPVHQIEFHEEDPDIRETFRAELSARGVENRMTDDLFEAP